MDIEINGRSGWTRLYSALAIETSLTLRIVFGLPLRQAEGFVGSLLCMCSSSELRDQGQYTTDPNLG